VPRIGVNRSIASYFCRAYAWLRARRSRPRRTVSLRTGSGHQPQLSEQPGEGRELSGAGDHRQARHGDRGIGGRASAAAPPAPVAIEGPSLREGRQRSRGIQSDLHPERSKPAFVCEKFVAGHEHRPFLVDMRPHHLNVALAIAPVAINGPRSIQWE